MRLVAKSMVAIAATVVIAACSSTGQNNVVVSKERYMAPVAKDNSTAQMVAGVEPILAPEVSTPAPSTSQPAKALASAAPAAAPAAAMPVVTTTASIKPVEPPAPEDILPVPVEAQIDDGQKTAAAAAPDKEKGIEPEKAEIPYLELTHYSAARVRYDETTGLIAFDSFAGSLNDNVRALLAATVGGQLVTTVSDNHRLVGDFTMTGKTVLEILDKMLVPFSAPHQIVATAYINNVVKVTYQSSEEPQ